MVRLPAASAGLTRVLNGASSLRNERPIQQVGSGASARFYGAFTTTAHDHTFFFHKLCGPASLSKTGFGHNACVPPGSAIHRYARAGSFTARH